MNGQNAVKVYKPQELTYSAYKRCQCGAGVAYPTACTDPFYFWACSYLLTNDIKYRPVAEPTGPFDAGILEDENKVKHDGAFSFVFNEFRKENIVGENRATTRPQLQPEPVKVKVKRTRKSK